MQRLFPPDIEQFIQAQLTSKRYQSENDLLCEAVRLLRDVENRELQIGEEVRAGLAQLERGEYTDYDDISLKERLDTIKTTGRQKLAAKQHRA